MKQNIYGLLLAVSFLLAAFQSYGNRPPGTVRAKENGKVVYVDKNPITHFDWYAFLWFCQHEDSLSREEIFLLLPDTNRYKTLEDFSKIRFDERKDTPVIGLNDSQKLKFAQWRTLFVNKNLAEKKKHPTFFQYTVISAEEYRALCEQNRKLKRRENEAAVLRCIVR